MADKSPLQSAVLAALRLSNLDPERRKERGSVNEFIDRLISERFKSFSDMVPLSAMAATAVPNAPGLLNDLHLAMKRLQRNRQGDPHSRIPDEYRPPLPFHGIRQFSKDLNEGVSGQIVDAGTKARNMSNVIFNTPDSDTLLAQAAEFIGQVIPPVLIKPPITKAGKALTFLAPIQMGGPGRVTRMGAEGVITGGMMQGMRAAAGRPTLASIPEPGMFDETPAARPEDETPAASDFWKWLDNFSLISEAGAAEALRPEGVDLSAGTDDRSRGFSTLPRDSITVPPAPPPVFSTLPATPTVKALPPTTTPQDLAQEQYHNEVERANTALKATLGVAAGVGVALAIIRKPHLVESLLPRKFAPKRNLGPSNFAPLGQGEAPPLSGESSIRALHEMIVDEKSNVNTAMENVELTFRNPDGTLTTRRAINDRDAQALDEQFKELDSYGRAAQGARDGRLGTITFPSVDKWARQVATVGEERKAILFQGMLARRELQSRALATLEREISNTRDLALKAEMETISDTKTALEIEAYLHSRGIVDADFVKPGLFRNAFRGATGPKTGVETIRLRASMARLAGDTELAALEADYHKITSRTLDYLVSRNVIDSEFVKELKHFTSDASGVSMFMPGKTIAEDLPDNFIRGLQKIVGVSTSKGKQLTGIKEFMRRGITAGSGTTTPLNPADALTNYLYHVVDHADKSVFQWNLLSRLTGINEAGEFLPNLLSRTNEYATYLGKQTIGQDRTLTQIINEFNDTPELAKVLEFSKKVPLSETQENLIRESVIVVRRGGDEHLFLVPNKYVKEAIEGRPKDIGWINATGKKFKTLFTTFTTRLPPFSIKAFKYATQQNMQNAIARGVVYTPADAVKGFWEHATTNISKEIAARLEFSLSSTPWFRMMPAHTQRAWLSNLEKRIERSYLTAVNREAGTLTGSAFNSEINPSISDIMKIISPQYGDNHSMLGAAWRMYKHILQAAYEGPALAAMMKKIGPRSNLEGNLDDYATNQRVAKLVREGAAFGRLTGGDVRQVGSSAASRTFHSWVPFSNPMIQAWATMGGSIKHGIKNGKYAQVATSITLPIAAGASAAIYNSMLSKEHNNHFWNVLTVEQRNNNYILYIPGGEPTDFIAISVSPEWTLANAISLEMIDMFTGASSGKQFEPNREFEVANPLKDQEGPVIQGAHLLAGLARFFDIPVPPLVQAAFAANNYSLRLGVHNEIIPLAGGERISGGNRGRSRYADSAMDTQIAAMVQAILGTAGGMFVAAGNAFNIGVSEGKRGDISDKLMKGGKRALDATGESLRSQVSYASPLVSSVFRPASSSSVSDLVRLKIKGADRVAQLRSRRDAGPGNVDLKTAVPSDAPITVPNRPSYEIIANFNENFQMAIANYKHRVRIIRRQIDAVRGAGEMFDKKRNTFPVTEGEKLRFIDKMNLELIQEDNDMLQVLRTWEAAVGVELKAEYGITDGFLLENFEINPNPESQLIN